MPVHNKETCKKEGGRWIEDLNACVTDEQMFQSVDSLYCVCSQDTIAEDKGKRCTCFGDRTVYRDGIPFEKQVISLNAQDLSIRRLEK